MGHHLSDPNELRRYRGHFLATGGLVEGVRELVGASWKRSLEAGVDPERLELPFGPAGTGDGRLVRAAQSVVDDLVTDLSATVTSLVLTDAAGLVLRRWEFDARLGDALESQGLAPGFSLAERYAGTTGIGVSLEIGKAFEARGPEHYAEAFQQFSTAASPIVNPLDGRTEGALQIVSWAFDADGLMAPYVALVGADIGKALASGPDKQLLEGYRRALRHSAKPIVSLNDETVIANRRAVEVLQQAGQDIMALRPPSGSAAATRRDVSLGADTTADVLFRPVSAGAPDLGTVLEFDVHRDVHRPPTSVAGTSPQWQAVLRLVQASARGRSTVTIEGEPGIGKLALARAIHEISAPEGPCRIFDAALAGSGDASRWLDPVSRALDGSAGTVVLTHVELLEPRLAHPLLATVEQHAHGRVRVIATRTTPGSPGHDVPPPNTERLRGMVIGVPPLRERPTDIPVLVAAVVRRAGRQHQRWPADVLRLMSRFYWPGNVRQLENVVTSVLLRRPTGDIELRDLPDDVLVGAVPRRLTRMELAEATAIMTALRETDGNKAEAAEALGISRSTLYRKLRSFGVDFDQFVL